MKKRKREGEEGGEEEEGRKKDRKLFVFPAGDVHYSLLSSRRSPIESSVLSLFNLIHPAAHEAFPETFIKPYKRKSLAYNQQRQKQSNKSCEQSFSVLRKKHSLTCGGRGRDHTYVCIFSIQLTAPIYVIHTCTWTHA